MNEKRFYLRLLMALVMIALSPTMIWAESVFTYTATNDLSSKFQNAFSKYGTVSCGTWTDATTPVTVTGKVM